MNPLPREGDLVGVSPSGFRRATIGLASCHGQFYAVVLDVYLVVKTFVFSLKAL